MIALSKRPADCLLRTWKLALIPPALSPKMVTC